MTLSARFLAPWLLAAAVVLAGTAGAQERVPDATVTQGNLHPDTLIEGGAALDAAVDAILAATEGRPHIFNLGHGITPQTPVAHVERMLARLRGQG